MITTVSLRQKAQKYKGVFMNWLFRKINTVPEQTYRRVYEGLSDSRKAHIDRMKKEEDKKRSLLASLLVQELLEKQGVAATLERDGNNRPYLEGCDLFVSITHSHEAVACALSQEPVGIDMEKIEPVRAALVRYVCRPEEWEYVQQGQSIDARLEEKQMLRRFFEVWTAKEAWFKKQGSGELLQVNTCQLEKTHFLKDGYLITIV